MYIFIYVHLKIINNFMLHTKIYKTAVVCLLNQQYSENKKYTPVYHK